MLIHQEAECPGLPTQKVAAKRASDVHTTASETAAAWDLTVIPRENRLGDVEDRKRGMTTHMCVWPGATHLLKFLNKENVIPDAGPVRIVELGAGTGWMGMTLAANLPNAHVEITDLAFALPDLQERVAQVGLSNTEVRELDWALLREQCLAPEGSDSTAEYDFVVGSELVWNMDCAETLPYAFRALATRDRTRIFYGHQPQYSPPAHARFLELCDELGLTLVDVGNAHRALLCEQQEAACVEDDRKSESSDDSEKADSANFASLFADEKDPYATVPRFTIYEVVV